METIFIQIAADRDRELIPTVEDAIAQATHPERLSFGICWQFETQEEFHYIDSLRTIKLVAQPSRLNKLRLCYGMVG